MSRNVACRTSPDKYFSYQERVRQVTLLVARLDKYFSYQERVYVRNVACRTSR